MFATLEKRLRKLLARLSTLAGVADMLKTRWYLLLHTLPKVLMALLLRFIVSDMLGVPGFFSPELVNGFSQSAVFVLAILISGVLDDYKESEKAPANLGVEIEGMSEQLELCIVLSAAERQRSGAASLDGPALHTEVLQLVEAVFAFLGLGGGGERAVMAAVSSHSRFVATSLALAGYGDQAGAIMDHAHEVRALLSRMYVIKRESKGGVLRARASTCARPSPPPLLPPPTPHRH
jgi:hypothetical protein